MTYSLTSSDFQDLGGQTNGALDTELLILSPVDQVIGDYGLRSISRIQQDEHQSRTLLQALDVAARERDANFVKCGGGARELR